MNSFIIYLLLSHIYLHLHVQQFVHCTVKTWEKLSEKMSLKSTKKKQSALFVSAVNKKSWHYVKL